MGEPGLGEELDSGFPILPWLVDRNCTDRGKDSQRLQVCFGLPRGHPGVQLPEEVMNLADFFLGVVTGLVAAVMFEVYRIWRGRDD